MKTNLVGLALLPSSEFTDFVKEKQNLILNKFVYVKTMAQPLHITLKRPFQVTNLADLECFCNDFVKKIKKPEILSESFGSFKTNIFFIDVKDTEELNKLHFKTLDSLKKEFSINPSSFEGSEKKFHLTIINSVLTEKQFFEINNFLNNLKKPFFNFKAHFLAILIRSGECWKIYKKFKIEND